MKKSSYCLLFCLECLKLPNKMVASKFEIQKIKGADQSDKKRDQSIWCFIIKGQGGLVKGNIPCYVANLDLLFKKTQQQSEDATDYR